MGPLYVTEGWGGGGVFFGVPHLSGAAAVLAPLAGILHLRAG